jgi:hypothetical protein
MRRRYQITDPAEQLEAMVNEHGLQHVLTVLTGLELICAKKAKRLSKHSVGVAALRKRKWAKASKACGAAARKIAI